MITRPWGRSLGRSVRNDAKSATSYHVASLAEGRELFDREARKTLGISGDDFLRRWDAGEYSSVPDTVEGRKIERLVILIPFARRTTA